MSKQPQYPFLDHGQEFIKWLTGSFCESYLLQGPCTKLSKTFGSISSHRPAFFSLAHGSLANGTYDTKITRKRISFTFDPGDMLLHVSLQIGLNLGTTEEPCAVLGGTSGFEPFK